MIPADDDRAAHAAVAHELVEQEPGAVALAVTQPADAGRKALERDALLGEADPALERAVLGKELEKGAVGRPNVLRVARERGPPERPLALAEERPDVQRDEPADREGVGDSGLLRLPRRLLP